ncbi:MAG: bifunctional metallophosphatase/5'-nucleotidase [Candidatus Promineifilaceae bacterium]
MFSGPLRLYEARANPHGADDSRLFLVKGDPTIASAEEIIPAEGVLLPPPRADLDLCNCHLKIFHINDLHGHIAQITANGDQPILSRFVSRLREVRLRYRDDPNTAVLAMSAGDDLVGAIFDELMGDNPDSFALHAGYRLYSAAGIDVAVLGNHDFDLGTEVLSQAILKDAQFPILSANLINCRRLAGLYYPAVILVTKGIRVGIIGLSTPAPIRHSLNTNPQITNPLLVINNILPALRPLCDVLIILSHLGNNLSSGSASVRVVGDRELARGFSPGSVHLIVGGHTHTILNEQGLAVDNIVNGIPIVQAGTLGRYLGEVDITFHRGKPAVSHARLSQTANLPVDETFERESVRPLLEMARPLFTRSLGQVISHPDLSTYAVRNEFATGESALANFIADALVARCHAQGVAADFAIVDSSVVRSGLPENELTFGAWFRIMPFADVLRIIWITGEQLKMLIRDNAHRLDLPGEPHTERGFLHFSHQIRYKVEIVGCQTGMCVREIMVNGIPLEEQLDISFRMVCTSFVREPAATWEKYAMRTLDIPLMDIHQLAYRDTHLFLRHELVAYISENGGVNEKGGAKRDGRIQIIYEGQGS